MARSPTILRSKLVAWHLKYHCPGVNDYISGARIAYDLENWEEAVSQIAKAFERAVYAIADMITETHAPRDFQGAIGIITDKGVITEETKKALCVRDVSLWGWVCLKGRHAEGVGRGKPADDWLEARYALDWAGSAIVLLGESYLQWLRKRRGS